MNDQTPIAAATVAASPIVSPSIPTAGALAPRLKAIARLATPTTLVMLAQIVASTFDAWMAGHLGTASLAGFALVFPIMILMQMMAAGGIGGGIAAAVARATGRNRLDEAHDLGIHAIIIALCCAALFTAATFIFGPAIYRFLSGARAGTADSAAVDAALAYAYPLFGGAFANWVLLALASVYRGLGNAIFPGRCMLAGSLLQIPLGYALTFGIAGLPGLGIAGIGLAPPIAQTIAAYFIWRRLRDGTAPITLTWRAGIAKGAYFFDILRVGLISSFSALMASMTTLLVTGLVAPFGLAALAGYGLGARLEFFLTPLTFGIGSALTVLVGQAAGRGNFAEARAVALTGSLIAAAICGAVGLFVSFAPLVWAHIFTHDPGVEATTVAYLTRLGPVYAFFGLGLSLTFAAQGVARMGIPIMASVLRLGGIFAAVIFLGVGGSLDSLYTSVALAMVAFGLIVLAGFLLVPWKLKTLTA